MNYGEFSGETYGFMASSGSERKDTKAPEGYEGEAIKLSHDALYALKRSKLSAAPGYRDPLAPKRDRKELRKGDE